MSRYRTCLKDDDCGDGIEETKQEINCNEFPCQIDGSEYCVLYSKTILLEILTDKQFVLFFSLQ